MSAVTFLVWLLPYLFSKEEQIEDVLQISYVQLDSAEKILLSKTHPIKPFEAKRIYNVDRNSVENRMVNDNNGYSNEPTYPYKKKQIQAVDINKADSLQFEALPTIGVKLSSRIVRYRDRLGGFLYVAQLKEVYGITDSAFNIILPYLKVEQGFSPQKIDINKADYATMRKHPYMDHEIIKMILAYRKSHGSYKNKEELDKLQQLDRAKLEKIVPYLAFDD